MELIETRIYLSVAALAAAALMLESTLTRVLAVAQFYHFAFLVVSLALLGFGASGSILSLFPNWISSNKNQASSNLRRILAISGVGFAVSVGAAYAVVNYLPFDSYSIVWDRRQVIYFGFYYLALTIPFLFAGLGIGAALSIVPRKSNLIYAVNLLGSAVGIGLALIIMQLAGVSGALLASGLVGLIAVIGFDWSSLNYSRFGYWGFVFTGTCLLALLTWLNWNNNAPIGVTISPYKGLSYAFNIPGSEKLFGAWNAISRVDVISGASTRVMPGLSYTSPHNPPEQNGLSIDADALLPVTLAAPSEFSAADYLPESFAFQIFPQAVVLVLEPGGGLGVLQALAGGASQVTTVVSNPLVIKAIAATSPEADVFNHERVETQYGSSRVFLENPGDQYQVIFIPLTDTYRPVASGAYSLNETYHLTVESLAAMIARLEQDGVLMASRWLQTPPSETIRFVATALEAMEDLGINTPGNKIAAYRGIQTMTILIKPDGWTGSELSQLREFTDSRRFDLVWSPDISIEEANRFNKLPEPIYYQLVEELITEVDKEEYYAEFLFDIQPATDDHPFFFHFFKWEQSPQIAATLGLVWQPFGGSGYFVLIALLILVTGLSTLLIILPITIKPVRSAVDGGFGTGVETSLSRWRVGVYFGSIGMAFLFLEIPLIQKSILSFEHPIYTFTFIVLVLLSYSSIGSVLSRKVKIPGKWLMAALFGLTIITPIVVNQIQEVALGWTLIQRALVFGISLAPMGIMMGFPFPLGLAWLEKSGSSLIPWAWAVNGCASVVAAVLAAILTLSFGFNMVLLLGAVFYGLAAMALKN
jgi:hypothetical protein